jgi:hypothetical protein
VKRKHICTALIATLAICLPVVCATLERLSLDDMITQSTAIVRGKVLGSRCAFNGPMIYTFTRVQVSQQWKGTPAQVVEVATPGGKAAGYEQNFAGAPRLVEGSEYLLFLWTGKSKITHVIGLSQGVFDLVKNDKGELTATRAAIAEPMLDPVTKQQVTSQNLSISLQDLSNRISATLAAGASR